MAAAVLWDALEATDPLYEWRRWYSHAYEVQYVEDNTRVWDDLREAVYNLCRDQLQNLGLTVDSDTWRFLVPYVGGGWMMTSTVSPTMQHVIQEEQ